MQGFQFQSLFTLLSFHMSCKIDKTKKIIIIIIKISFKKIEILHVEHLIGLLCLFLPCSTFLFVGTACLHCPPGPSGLCRWVPAQGGSQPMFWPFPSEVLTWVQPGWASLLRFCSHCKLGCTFSPRHSTESCLGRRCPAGWPPSHVGWLLAYLSLWQPNWSLSVFTWLLTKTTLRLPSAWLKF